MVSRTLVAPSQGDVVWLDHDPQAGHEQAGRRPALVLSPQAYNSATGLMLCCPITIRGKGYPFEVPVVGVKDGAGVILADQPRRLDWAARRAEFAGKAADDALADVLAKLRVLLTQHR
jgi:mRNA interferase MazF